MHSMSKMAPRPKVYITRRIPQKGVDVLLQDCDVKQWESEQAPPRGEMMHCVVGAEAILCMPGDMIDKQLMDAAGPQLRVIATISELTSHIDCKECESRGIKIIKCPLQPPQNLADLTVALVLLTIKKTLTGEEQQHLCQSVCHTLESQTIDKDGRPKNGTKCSRPQLQKQMSEEQMAFQWSNGKPVNTNCLTWRTIASKTFGVYGRTETGASVARLLKNLGVGSVLVSDVDVDVTRKDGEGFYADELTTEDYQVVPFSELLTQANIICVCGSAGSGSDNVFSRESFEKMKRDAILVTSRSDEAAVDYVSLYQALRQGQIKAAGLNDCNQEACPLKTMLQGLDNCVFMPQTQEAVYDMRHQVSVIVAKNLTLALKSV